MRRSRIATGFDVHDSTPTLRNTAALGPSLHPKAETDLCVYAYAVVGAKPPPGTARTGGIPRPTLVVKE